MDIKSIFTQPMKRSKNELWSEKDFLLITYADSIKKNNQKNLITLNNFLKNIVKSLIMYIFYLFFLFI